MLNIYWKGERTVGKANKGINVEKNNYMFKKLEVKKEKRKKKEKESSTELQKPNIEADAHNNNEKCD